MEQRSGGREAQSLSIALFTSVICSTTFGSRENGNEYDFFSAECCQLGRLWTERV